VKARLRFADAVVRHTEGECPPPVLKGNPVLEHTIHLGYNFLVMSAIVDQFLKQKKKRPDRLVLFESGSSALFACKDAEEVSSLLGLPISMSLILGHPAVTFTLAKLPEVLTRLSALGRKVVAFRRTGKERDCWEECSLESPPDISKIEFAHKVAFFDALDELKHGKMETAWAWFAFPRLRGTAEANADSGRTFRTLRESRVAMKHKLVAPHIREIATMLLGRRESAEEIFGSEAETQVKASATLFALTAKESGDRELFSAVLKRFFGGGFDAATVAAIAAELDAPRDDTPRDLFKSDTPGGVSVRGAKRHAP